MQRLLVIACLVLFCSSCGLVDDMKDMMEKQQRLTQKIKHDFGWDAVIGWNINNGTLTQVTVTFSDDDVNGEKVVDLKAKLENLINQSFDQKPKAIIIQLITLTNKNNN